MAQEAIVVDRHSGCGGRCGLSWKAERALLIGRSHARGHSRSGRSDAPDRGAGPAPLQGHRGLGSGWKLPLTLLEGLQGGSSGLAGGRGRLCNRPSCGSCKKAMFGHYHSLQLQFQGKSVAQIFCFVQNFELSNWLIHSIN